MPGTFCDVQHMFKFMIMFTWCFTMGEAHSLWIGIKGHYPKYWLISTITMLGPLFWEWLLVARISVDMVLCI